MGEMREGTLSNFPGQLNSLRKGALPMQLRFGLKGFLYGRNNLLSEKSGDKEGGEEI